MSRFFIIVLDSFGIGQMPDAEKFGDFDVNTIGAVSRTGILNVPNMRDLGLFRIEGVDVDDRIDRGSDGSALIARMTEKSAGKDTTIGHWEIAGLVSEKPLPTYPEGFPKEVLDEFSKRTGRGVLCNKPYSGTEVIKDYGDEV